MVIPAPGGQPRVLAESLDRPVRAPIWSKDGASLSVVVVDDRSQYPARIRSLTPAPGAPGSDSGRRVTNIERLVNTKSVVGNLSAGPGDGAFAVLWSTDIQPAEVAGLENGNMLGCV